MGGRKAQPIAPDRSNASNDRSSSPTEPANVFFLVQRIPWRFVSSRLDYNSAAHKVQTKRRMRPKATSYRRRGQ